MDSCTGSAKGDLLEDLNLEPKFPHVSEPKSSGGRDNLPPSRFQNWLKQLCCQFFTSFHGSALNLESESREES